MTITPVDYEYVNTHFTDPRLHRISVCDDGNYGKTHSSVRIKAVKNLTVEELESSLGDPKYGFILVDTNE